MKEDFRDIERLYEMLCDSDHTYHVAAVEYVYKNHQYSLDMESIRFKGYHDGFYCICWVNVAAAEIIRKTDFLTWADDLWRHYIETGVV